MGNDRIALQFLRRPVCAWGGKLLPLAASLVGIALSAAALGPLTATIWILAGAVADLNHAKLPSVTLALIAAVFAAWSWCAVWNFGVDSLQARLVRPVLEASLPPGTRPLGYVRVRQGRGGVRPPHDVGFLIAEGDALRFVGARTRFRIRREEADAPAKRRGSDTVFVPVCSPKAGIFFSADEAQELAQKINKWRETTEVVLASAVDKAESQG